MEGAKAVGLDVTVDIFTADVGVEDEVKVGLKVGGITVTAKDGVGVGTFKVAEGV